MKAHSISDLRIWHIKEKDEKIHWNLETLISDFVSAVFTVQLQTATYRFKVLVSPSEKALSYHIGLECQFCNFNPSEKKVTYKCKITFSCKQIDLRLFYPLLSKQILLNGKKKFPIHFYFLNLAVCTWNVVTDLLDFEDVKQDKEQRKNNPKFALWLMYVRSSRVKRNRDN